MTLLSSWRLTARSVPAIVLAVAAVLMLSTAAQAMPTSPDDAPSPTSDQLANSIRVYRVENSVRVYELTGSVSPVETQTQEGLDMVLSLDSDILFDFGSADLGPSVAPRLTELVADVPPGATVRVTGHTDSIGDDASNLELSQRRAQAVAAAIAAARPDLVLDVQGRGETEPVASNEIGGEDNPEGREMNRRVDVRYAG